MKEYCEGEPKVRPFISFGINVNSLLSFYSSFQSTNSATHLSYAATGSAAAVIGLPTTI